MNYDSWYTSDKPLARLVGPVQIVSLEGAFQCHMPPFCFRYTPARIA